MSIENKNYRPDFQQRSSGDPSHCSDNFTRISLSSTPKRRTSKIHFVANPGSGMLMTSRQEFLPGEPNGGVITYSRRGGVYLYKWGIISIIIGVIILTTAVGLLVYFLAPPRNEVKQIIEDDLSWDLGEIETKSSNEIKRLSKDVLPSYYRIKIKPNLTSYTFEGKVSITLSTNKEDIKEISLHSKALEILNDTILTEQSIVTSPVPIKLSRKKRDADILDELPNSQNSEVVSSNDPVVISAPTIIENNTDISESVVDIIPTNNDPTNDATTEKITTAQILSPEVDVGDQNLKPNVTIESTTQSIPVLSQPKTKKMNILSRELNPSTDILTFTLESNLNPNVNYTLEIHFKGVIDESLNGFYRSSYGDLTYNITKTLAVTQFEPISARKAFPCFDEPAFKATYEISIARNKNMTAISNMPLLSEEEVAEDEGMIWSHFERSLPMSPYLVAYCISELQSIDAKSIINETDHDDVQFKIWARKELLPQTAYAADIGPKLLDFYEKYFGVPYALPKIDLVAIPDFATGAMENWGMLTFKETNLIVDPDKGSIRSKKNVAMTIAHEIAHQWFGNLVTMQWWADLWLNEGFASYMEYIGVNEIEPEWKLLEQFTLDKMDVLALDSIQSTRPVSTIIDDEAQISQQFDQIAYMKAASLIGMLEHVLTTEIFRSGMYNYMKKWQYKNADQDDLWHAFTSALNNTNLLSKNVSIESFMDSWTLQDGYPVINVTRNYQRGTAEITQNRFFLQVPESGMTDQLWYVPITYAVGNTDPQSWTTIPQVWLEKVPSKTITLPENANNTWIYLNVLSTGHFRINYDYKNWKLIEYELFDEPDRIPPISRAQILDDAFNLARAGQINYTIALDLTKYMKGTEEHYLPWFAALDNLQFLYYGLQRSDRLGLFQEYISRLIMPKLKALGFSATLNDTTQDALLRDRLIYWACLAEEPECLDWVKEQFNNWMNEADPDKNNPIPANNRGTVYATALRMGSRKEYDFLFDRMKNSNDPQAISEIIVSLPNTRNTWQLYSILEYSMTTMDIQLTPMIWSSFTSDLASQIAFKFVIDNWERVYKKYSQVDNQILSFVIDGAFSGITTEQELRQFKRFIQDYKDDLSNVSYTIQKNLEAAVLRIQWGKTKISDIEWWLVKYEETKTTSINEFSTLYGKNITGDQLYMG